MLAQVKKLVPQDFPGRFGAWWDGRDYEPAVEGSEGEAAAAPSADRAAEPPAALDSAPAAPDPGPIEPVPTTEDVALALHAVQGGAEAPAGRRAEGAPDRLRIEALETLWGEGRFAPGSPATDAILLDALFDGLNIDGGVGFIGADPKLIEACAARSDRALAASEWRPGCAARLGQGLGRGRPTLTVQEGEVDRPKLPAGLAALLSVEAFAFADHKAGLVARAFRALEAGGRWVILDTVRHTKKTPAEPFASAFAEPMLATPEDIEELLVLSGFSRPRRLNLTVQVLEAASERYHAFAAALDGAVRQAAARDGAFLLQELTWEARTWRSRMRALAGGALSVEMWVADKPRG